MPAIFLSILYAFAGSFLSRVLLGAGLGLATAGFILTFVNYYIDKAVSTLSAGGVVLGLIGLSGTDVALSIIVGALVARTTIDSLNIRLVKK